MKRNLLKALGISFLIFVVLSWIIPVSTVSGEKVANGGYNAVGLFDLVGVPVQTLVTFALYIAVFSCIGGLYGVMSKTGALGAWTENITRKFTNKEKGFLIFTIIFFVILSSLTGLLLPLFALVPLFAMVLFKMNYDKVTTMASTVGAMLVGSMASTYGFNITGYTKNILSLDINFQIIAKLVLLVVLTTVLVVFVVKCSNRKEEQATIKEAKVEVKEEKKTKASAKTGNTKTTKKAPAKKTTTKKSTKKSSKSTTKNMAVATDIKKVKNEKSVSTLPLIIIFVLMLIVTMVGMFNWYYSFKIEVFNDIHTTIMAVKIGDFPIFENLLSGISQLGYWGNNEFIIIMVIAAALIAFIYRLSFGQFVESFIAGIKKMLPTAIYAALASIILSVLYQASYQGTGTIADTVFNATMSMTDGFNVLTTGLTALIGSFFYNDLYYLLSGMQAFMSGFDASSLSIAGLLVQSVYALGMILLPTSVVLIAGLSYFDVSFKQWIKYIWKFAVIALLVILLVCAILTVL